MLVFSTANADIDPVGGFDEMEVLCLFRRCPSIVWVEDHWTRSMDMSSASAVER